MTIAARVTIIAIALFISALGLVSLVELVLVVARKGGLI